MAFPRRGRRRLPWLLVLGLTALPSPAHAQYFGRNKVQYENFDFRVLKTQHFDIYFYPGEKAAAAVKRPAWRSAGTPACRAFSTTSSSGRQPLILYASAPQFQQTNAVGGISAREPAGSPKPSGGGSCCPLAGPSAT